MKKHVIVIRSNPVDADSRVQKEVCALQKGGYVVSILAWDRDSDYPLRTEQCRLGTSIVDIMRVGIKAEFGGGFKKNFFPLLKFQFVIHKFLRSHRSEIDIVHACDFDTAFTAYHSVNHRRIKVIYDIFDYYIAGFQVPKILKSIIESLDHHIINRADATIICTEQRKRQIEGTHPKHLTVIHNTPPKVNLASSVSNTTKIKVAYFGVLTDGRLLRELLDVIARNRKYELHIGGFGVLEELIKQYADENENIVFYGKLGYDDVLRYENQCDVMTAIYDPSYSNHIFAAPNKFYEALMLGKPLIMVRGTGMSDVVENNHVGVLIDYNRQSLSDALDELVSQKVQWPDIALRMHELYQDYSWETMEIRLLELYKTIME